MNIHTKTTKPGRAIAFKLASGSHALSIGNALESTRAAMKLAEWIGMDEDKLEAAELVVHVQRRNTNFRYLVNQVKELYGQMTGIAEAEEAEPPEKEPVEPAKADNSTSKPGTVRRPSKRPRRKKT